MSMEVMKTVEQVGFRIARIVTDNHQTKAALLRKLSKDGALAHEVAHSLREGDPLFLSFDPNLSIKSLRSNFLEWEMIDGEQLIQGGPYLKKLFQLQSQLLVKPVGILQAAKTGNAPTSSESKVPVRPAIQLDETVCFPAAIQSAARELSSELGFMKMGCIGQTDLELAPIAFLAGYLTCASEE
ncbi:hypothetical protein HPB47_007038, partial [Ixodes persulcatus]